MMKPTLKDIKDNYERVDYDPLRKRFDVGE